MRDSGVSQGLHNIDADVVVREGFLLDLMRLLIRDDFLPPSSHVVCMRVVPSGIVFVFLVRHLAPMILSLRLNSAWLEDTKEMGKMTTDTHMGLLLVRHQLRMSMQ